MKQNLKITIKNLTRRRIPPASSIKRIISKVLKLERAPFFNLSVTYVNDGRMRRLNKKYRGRDSFTDVLAFSMREGRRLKGQERFLGDIVISVDAAERQARYFNSTKERELKLYLIHGILHLLGYTNGEIRKRQEQLMGAQ